MCREEAQDLSKLFKSGALGKAKLVGVIKEVAPCSTAKTDEELGVNEFQEKYWPHPLYLDEEKSFYEALGNRKITGLSFSWNPFTLYKSFVDIGKRMKEKNVSGNMRGEGLTLGGIFVISNKKQSIEYTYAESTGKEIPTEEIIEATKQC